MKPKSDEQLQLVLSKADAEGIQLDLYSKFFVSEENWSHTLELWDSIPKINHTHFVKFREAQVIDRECPHRGKNYEIQITPATIKGKDGEVFSAFPNKREDLILHALRYLAVQQTVPAVIGSKDSNKGDVPYVSLCFTIYQLRKELARTGHGYKHAEIVEGLEILSKAQLSVKCGKYRASGTFIAMDYTIEDDQGFCHVSFHPLAAQAIFSGATRRIRYDLLMSLKSPIARWIYMRLCHMVINAKSPSFASDGIGLKFSMEEAFTQSGVQQVSQHRNNVQKIRKALDELKAKGFLHQDDEIGMAYKEDRENLRWTAYPSNSTVSDIIHASKESYGRPQDNMQHYLGDS